MPTQISNSKSSTLMVCRGNGMVISAAAHESFDGEGRNEGDKYEEQLLLWFKHRPVLFGIVEETKQLCWQHEQRMLKVKEQSLNDVVKFLDTSASSALPNPKSESQHHRKNGSMCKADRLKTMYNCVHMMLGTGGQNAGHRMVDIFIIDSGSPFHCTGDRSLFSDDDYTEAPPGSCIYGASGKEMPVYGVGSIRNERIQLQDVRYVPSLNKPNINKTIISVSKLTKLGYSVVFNFDGTSCTVIDKRNLWAWRNEIVGKAHMEHGHYMLDYLRVPLDRAHVPTSSLQEHGLVKSLWSAALTVTTGWNTITEPLSSQRASAQRPPV